MAKSETLKQAVADPLDTAKPVRAEVVKRGRGRPPKEAVANLTATVNVKAVKKELDALKKQALTSEKEHTKALEALTKQMTADIKTAEKPLDAAIAEKAAALKAVEKAELKVAKTISQVNKEADKLRAAHGKARDKLIQAKDKADSALAKQIAKLSALVGE